MGCVMSNFELVMELLEKSSVTNVPFIIELGEISPGTNISEVKREGVKLSVWIQALLNAGLVSELDAKRLGVRMVKGEKLSRWMAWDCIWREVMELSLILFVVMALSVIDDVFMVVGRLGRRWVHIRVKSTWKMVDGTAVNKKVSPEDMSWELGLINWIWTMVWEEPWWVGIDKMVST